MLRPDGRLRVSFGWKLLLAPDPDSLSASRASVIVVAVTFSDLILWFASVSCSLASVLHYVLGWCREVGVQGSML